MGILSVIPYKRVVVVTFCYYTHPLVLILSPFLMLVGIPRDESGSTDEKLEEEEVNKRCPRQTTTRIDSFLNVLKLEGVH